MSGPNITRRALLASAAAAGCTAVVAPAIAQAAPRIVVIGGGFAGASCARALKEADARLAVTLVETNATFTACPFSNSVIAGLRDLRQQQFTYDRLAAGGIAVKIATAAAVDPHPRTVTLGDGTRISYDRLV
jgi:sulfide dehydrogenase [flavocytochrome c] flavoprotein subunit